MELKLRNPELFSLNPGLLIVPYGIETFDGNLRPPYMDLLIVPYGIETGDTKHDITWKTNF